MATDPDKPVDAAASSSPPSTRGQVLDIPPALSRSLHGDAPITPTPAAPAGISDSDPRPVLLGLTITTAVAVLIGFSIWFIAALVVRLNGDGATTAGNQTQAAVDGSSTVGESPLTIRGMGPVRVGMTVSEAEAALGSAITEVSTPVGECRYGVVADGGPSPDLMILVSDGDFASGTIVRIELTARTHATGSGITLGSTADEVMAAYGERIVATPHADRVGPDDLYLTFVPFDPADADYRMVMETTDGAVTAIRGGLMPAVEWTEGCS